MFGTLRLLLALLVALAHAGISLHGYHIGVPAVIVFFILSGFVVASLLADNFPSRSDVLAFYFERFLRLAPLYYFFLLMGYLAFLYGVASPWLVGPPDTTLWIANLLIIPLDFYMFFERINGFFLIPVAWSLGLEIQFYLLAPWLLRTPFMLFVTLAASFAIHAAANLGWLHTDWFGYRLLCGTLFMFLSGAMLFHSRTVSRWLPLLLSLWIAELVLIISCGILGRWQGTFSLEMGLGFVVGLPVLALLARIPRKRFDDWLGNLAYGVFLSHFAVMWLAGKAGWLNPQAGPVALYVALCIAAAALGHLFVERPIVRWRHRLRTQQLQQKDLCDRLV